LEVYLLGSAPKETPDRRTIGRYPPTWRPDAMFSTKNQFKILKTYLSEIVFKRRG
jgi:hypothetical protein